MTCTFCNDRKLINCLKTNQISDNEALFVLGDKNIVALMPYKSSSFCPACMPRDPESKTAKYARLDEVMNAPMTEPVRTLANTIAFMSIADAVGVDRAFQLFEAEIYNLSIKFVRLDWVAFFFDKHNEERTEYVKRHYRNMQHQIKRAATVMPSNLGYKKDLRGGE